MLGWFRSQATCPVPPADKAWIEARFGWLTDEFGAECLLQGVQVLPTTEFFPAHYEGAEDELVELMQRVAGYMRADPSRLRLQFYDERLPHFVENKGGGTAGLYNEVDGYFDIWLESATLDDPLHVVATLAHELGHVRLLGERRISADEEDHEPLTDLLTVFLGLGIITSNSVIHENYWETGQFAGWSIGKRGYLTMEKYGYALALYARARNELDPAWLRHLRPDVRTACKRGLRYIVETGDCDYRFP